jgi:hypothetical protein
MSCKCYDDDENGIEKEKRDLVSMSNFINQNVLVTTVTGDLHEGKIISIWDDAISFLVNPKKDTNWDKIIFLRHIVSIVVIE